MIGALILLLSAQQAPIDAPHEASACSYLGTLKEGSLPYPDGVGLISIVFEADLTQVSQAAGHVRGIAWLNPGDFLNSDYNFEPIEIPIVENKGLLVITRRIDSFHKDSSGGLYDAACGFAQKWKLSARGWSIRIDQEVVGASFAVVGIK